MKKVLLPALIALFAVACQKDAQDTERPVNQPSDLSPAVTTSGSSTGTGTILQRLPAGYELPPCVVETETPLMAGQSTNVGTVSVWNDASNLYVSYQTDGAYRLKKTHLFVGSCSAIPVNNSGNPRIGQYPYQTSHGTTGVSLFIYTIPLSSLPAGCLCVSAHAEVVAYNASGSLVFSETGWGFGEQITDGGSWAMKFGYCLQDCDGGPR